MDLDPPANQPSQPTGGDVVTHAVKAKAVTTQGSSGTTAGGKPVCRTGDMVRMNVMTAQQAVAQQTVPLIKAAGTDMAGGKGGKGAGKDKKGKTAQPAKKCTKAGHPVDVATGYVVDEAMDFTLPGAIPLVWSRTYSSSRAKRQERPRQGRLGPRLRPVDRASTAAPAILHDGDGRTLTFLDVEIPVVAGRRCPHAADGSFHRGERLTLTPSATAASSSTSTTPASPAASRRSRRRAAPCSAPSATATATRSGFDYEDGALVRVTDTAGRQILVKNDAKGRVVRVEVWASPPAESGSPPAALELWVDYTYQPEGELASATDALGRADPLRVRRPGTA